MLLFVLFLFTLITGIGIPHFQHRGKALLFLAVATFFSLQGAGIVSDQRVARLAELRETDPTAYLTELRSIDENRWFTELRTLDPDAHAAEAERRGRKAKAERLSKCTDKNKSLAYVMIQTDVQKFSALTIYGRISRSIRFGNRAHWRLRLSGYWKLRCSERIWRDDPRQFRWNNSVLS
ncbi:hypothetical protein [Ruegeria arenilitoris]|uniref:hypothetical protein n=1 Tax=Ruegeria arenilitoris TaxID=1173585 RepID=UPI001C2C27A3|nr:hypothetical protein [Ruegeria arenilitoris]